MSLTERSLEHELRDPRITLEREIDVLHQLVADARRTRWHGDDVVIEPDFENFLATLSTPGLSEPGPVWQRDNHRNAWRETRR
jgi:hypothetical protein